MVGDGDEKPGPSKVLSDLFDSGLFSDFQIHCRDRTVYNVHKSIICTQNSFSRNARSNIVRLENDDPAAGKALVEFFYRFEYTAGLQEFTDGELIFHTQVYAIGEKYHVQGLKDLAKVHFEEVYEAASSYEELHFGGVVDAVYNTTFASDNGLRSLVVKIVQHDLQNLMANVDYFTEIVTRNGEFSRDLASALFQDREKIKPRYPCPQCGIAICMKMPAQDDVYRPHCQQLHATALWKEVPPSLSKYRCGTCKGSVEMEPNPRQYASSIIHCLLCGSGQTKDTWGRNNVDDNGGGRL
ncbi:hypothetical protein IWX90DRAFT_1308 [Phyllosticta citrichinensis]|uniref:BTB domain-containing protein n=1 Tax=Phyllosticta citrichinensis TaxID=1130410 RepID=A0ABR1Y587_9PEZI